MEDNTELRLRLKNCLQTIIDLKDDIDAMPFGSSFTIELGTLKDFMLKLSDIAINEFEVQRVEAATARFLGEIAPLLNMGKESGQKNGRLQ